MRRSRPHFLIFGRVHPASFLEGGRLRLTYMNEALERLDGTKTFFHPSVSTRLPLFLAALVVTRLGLVLANPFRRRYVISHATPPSPLLRRILAWRCTLLYFDVQDDPRAQFRDLGIRPNAREDLDEIGRRLDGAMADYRLVGFATDEFADLYPVEQSRRVIAPNASDPDHFPVTELPAEPTVALVGGASPGRGADLLIEAAILARREVPDLRLRLALNDLGGRGNLGELRELCSAEPWISFEEVDFRTLPAFLADATVCAIPHRRSAYLDLSLPIKLFDYMAAGRPVVATNCRELAKFVERERVGLVCEERAEDMAAKLVSLLRDRVLAAELGQNGRRVVVDRYSWRHTQEAVLRAIQLALSPREGRSVLAGSRASLETPS
jgi:glycosyltransferase involved in cell wall biosynthesis